MMIKKFNKINNVFSYAFFDWDSVNPYKGGNPNDPIDVFSKNNIIFGENGNGKTVLIKIFKSLYGLDINLEKHWDFGDQDQKISILLEDDSELTYENGAWSGAQLKGKFVIFDKVFIDRFVHSAGDEDHNTAARKQTRGKHIIYLGNFASYNKEINTVNTVKNSLSEKNKRFLNSEKELIKVLLPDWFDESDLTKAYLSASISACEKENLDSLKTQLKTKEDELSKVTNAVKNQTNVQKLEFLKKIDINFSFNYRYKNEQGEQCEEEINPDILFAFTVSKGIQETINKISDRKDFIKEGLGLIDVDSEDCPFCAQKIKNGDFIHIIKEYQKIFDASFLKESKSMQDRLDFYKNILIKLRDFALPNTNPSNFLKIKQYIAINEEFPSCQIEQSDKEIIESEIEKVLSKDKQFLKEFSDSQYLDIKKIIQKLEVYVKGYNDFVEAVNAKLKDLNKQISEGKLQEKQKGLELEIKTINLHILFLEKKEKFERYIKILEQYEKNEKVVKSLENIYQKLKSKIVEEFQNFANEYFDLVKEFVEKISPNMDIFDICGNSTFSRTGREPAQCGFEVQYNGEDKAKNLSEGERQVVALAFFFARLRKDSIKDKIIVLDDPISSFDTGKRKSTAELINLEASEYPQLFVMTCDPLFREYCLKEIENRRAYYVFKTRGASSIHFVSPRRETIYQAFESDFQKIDDFDGSNENVVLFGQKLRFCLETKIKEDYFGYSQDKLSNMIEQVAGNGREKIDNLITNKDEILRIYKYCNTGGLAHYPRDGSTSWNELKDNIQKYLSLNL